jgi:hypothetical protein
MIALYWNQLFETIVRALPAVFLVGAPILLVALALAAFVDARVPHGE